VLDAGNGRVQVFDAQGNVRSAFGAFGTRLGELGDSCGGVVVDQRRRVIIADSGNDRVQVFGSS
jgi:NHL repeat-containing protein